MSVRAINKTVKGQRTIDGAGVRLVRVLGNRTVRDFDPFLMLDAFDSTDPEDYIAGFPTHPHRGIETVTYLASGQIDHGDSMGNKGSITDGCCQWMTAGSGIMHKEMPQPSDHMLGLQLWVNLPAKDKMAVPKYHGIEAEDIPVVSEEGAEVHVLSGTYKGKGGAMQADYVPVTFLDVRLDPGTKWVWDTPAEYTVFAYLFTGDLEFEGFELPAHEAVLFTKGDQVLLHAGKKGAMFVILSAPPLHESVAWGGPIVMNTEDELRTAFMELENNTFIKHKAQGA